MTVAVVERPMPVGLAEMLESVDLSDFAFTLDQIDAPIPCGESCLNFMAFVNGVVLGGGIGGVIWG